MVSLLELTFLGMTLVMIVVGFFVNSRSSLLPESVARAFRYGKFAGSGADGALPFVGVEMPKSRFRHFYVSGTTVVVLAFLYAADVYRSGRDVPEWLLLLLDLFCGSGRSVANTPMATTLALFLLTVQCTRRLYETFFVQVFSEKAKINMSHYLVGHFHYVGCTLAILGRAAGFTRSEVKPSELEFLDIHTSIVALPSVALFLFAWKRQFESNIILASLRKNKSNKVVTQNYSLPTAGWFRYVSSPHLLFEIVIYVALQLLLVQNFTWLCVVAWVVSNQVETAILSHEWYKKTFPKFPKDRKVLVPYIF